MKGDLLGRVAIAGIIAVVGFRTLDSLFSPWFATSEKTAVMTPREEIQRQYGYVPDWMPPDDQDTMADLNDPNYCSRPGKQFTPVCTTGQSVQRQVQGTKRGVTLADQCANGDQRACNRYDDDMARTQYQINQMAGMNAADDIRAGVNHSQRRLAEQNERAHHRSFAEGFFGWFRSSGNSSDLARGDYHLKKAIGE